MKLRTIASLLPFVTLLLCAGVQPLFAQSAENKLVDGFISRQAKKEGAAEFKEARKLFRGDVDGDGRDDLAVLFTLEGFLGGNSYIQYLAVFLASGKTYRFADTAVVGGKLNRDVESVSIVDGELRLDTLEYAESDSACCPSEKGHAVFVLFRGKLREKG